MWGREIEAVEMGWRGRRSGNQPYKNRVGEGNHGNVRLERGGHTNEIIAPWTPYKGTDSESRQSNRVGRQT